MRGPEGKIQDDVIKYAREKHGCLVKKNEVGRYFIQSGWPDAVFFPQRQIGGERGHVPFFIEFKRPGGKLTPLQEHVKDELGARGYNVYVVDGKVQGKRIIDKECK